MLAAVALLSGCSGASNHTGSSAQHALSWLAEHAPSAIDVAGISAAAIRFTVPNARVRQLPEGASTAACRVAQADRALLGVFARHPNAAALTDALDCGPALYRDPYTVIIAPR